MMHSTDDLRRCLNIEKRLYLEDTLIRRFKQFICYDPKIRVWKFQCLLRKEGYYHCRTDMLSKLCYLYYHRRRSILGIKLGLEMWPDSFSEGLKIEHAGNIVVNGHAKIGKNCVLHGSNCIGNNGFSSACPVLGNNIHLGVGAKVIGDVVLADNIVVAAGAVVVHSFEEPGITIAGVPARKIK